MNHPTQRTRTRTGWLLILSLAFVINAWPADVTINISTSPSDTLRLSRGFSGFNAPQLRNAVEYTDPNFLAFTAQLKPGWIRFPSGVASSVFDWSIGKLRQDWINVFLDVPPYFRLLKDAEQLTTAKGGVFLSDFSVFANTLGVKSTICFNIFTDNNPSSATNMVLAAKSNQLQVLAWELGNEPFLFPTHVPNATVYADSMRSYYAQIIAADPNALVSVPLAGQFTGILGEFPAWDAELAAYPSRFWNAVSTNIYPLKHALFTPPETQAFLNGILAHGSTKYVDSYLVPLVGSQTPIFIPEFNCTAKPQLEFQTYIYNGIFLAEYIARLSTHPSIRRVGVHALYMGRAHLHGMIHAARDFEYLLRNHVYPNSVNTTGWPFDFYMTAPGLALAVANQAINASANTWRTTVTGGVTVPIRGYDGQPIPSVFAQAYKGENGKSYIVVTNKAGIPQTTSIQMNGTPVPGLFIMSYVASNDPTAANTNTDRDRVQIQTTAASGQITLPAYSVMRVEW